MLCYQIRQAFSSPEEITPEEANRIAETTLRAGRRASTPFSLPPTQTRQHIHNHIYYNSTSLDCTHGSSGFVISSAALCSGSLTAFALKMICPSLPTPSCTARVLSPLWQERATRLRASTLGDGYDPEDIKAVIAGSDQSQSILFSYLLPRRVNLIVIYVSDSAWYRAQLFRKGNNLSDIWQLQLMQEQNITEHDQLSAKCRGCRSPFHVPDRCSKVTPERPCPQPPN